MLRRQYEVFGDERPERLAGLSNGHLYNVRASRTYRTRRSVFTKTRAKIVAIAERRKPRPDGQPGFVRVDTVHQGDRDGAKRAQPLAEVARAFGLCLRGPEQRTAALVALVDEERKHHQVGEAEPLGGFGIVAGNVSTCGVSAGEETLHPRVALLGGGAKYGKVDGIDVVWIPVSREFLSKGGVFDAEPRCNVVAESHHEIAVLRRFHRSGGEAFKLRWRTMLNHAFTATNARVTRARRPHAWTPKWVTACRPAIGGC